jgi:DHA1 family bicyclomycin/chloramphenicol resistance-like MFS transporter
MSGRLYYYIVIAMEILVGAEVDIMVPSFPEMRRVFDLTPFMVELTLSLNLLAQFCACLFVGNLGDRYGRRPVMIYGFAIFILGSVLCLCGQVYWHVLVGRALQGMGITAPAVLAYLVLADRYTPQQQQQMMAVLNATITAALAFGPVIGSCICLYFGWRGSFVVLLVGGILCFFLCFFLPKQEEKVQVTLSLREYLPLLRSRKARAYIGGITLLIVPYWTFVGFAPILYMEGFHVELRHFGLYQGALCAVFAIASFMTGIMIRRFGEARCFYSSLSLIVLFICVALLLVYVHTASPIAITLAMLIASVGVAMPFVVIFPLSLEAIPGARGRISALIFSLRMLLVALLVQWISYFYNGTFTHLGMMLAVVYIAAVYLCYGLYQKKWDRD